MIDTHIQVAEIDGMRELSKHEMKDITGGKSTDSTQQWRRIYEIESWGTDL